MTKLEAREARIKTMQILYVVDFNDLSIEEAMDIVLDGENNEIINDYINLYKKNEIKIDSIISSALQNYSLSRLNLVDKAIIRLATAELLNKEVDKRIVIDEALEITKLYTDQGDHKAVSFNNKLLDNISKII